MLKGIKKYFPAFFPVERRKTAFQTLEINRRSGHFVLDSLHVNYSFGNLHRVFQHAFQMEGLDTDALHDVLILGFGAGSVARILQDEWGCAAKLTGVEVDAGVIDLAEKYFDLKTLKYLDIQIADAFSNFTVFCFPVVKYFLTAWPTVIAISSAHAFLKMLFVNISRRFVLLKPLNFRTTSFL